MVAGMLVQNTLKYLLNFGEVSDYLGYNAMIDFFPKMSLRPNIQCSDRYCQQRQREYNARPKVEKVVDTKEDDAVVHSDNIYGIELVSEDEGTSSAPSTSTTTAVSTGLKLAYEAPDVSDEPAADASSSANDDGISLEELMAQMKSI